ncbi:MAG: phosphatase PAP2 family protein [Bacillota bacterium]
MQKFSNRLIAADNQIFYYFQSKLKNSLIDKFFILITHLGGRHFLTLLTLFFIISKPNINPMLGWELAAVLISSHLFVHVLKRLINRKRPYKRLADVEYLIEPFESYSFPSGHTTASFAAAVTLSFTLSQLSILFIFTALTVGVSRIYLGVHYPSDILIGIIIALVFSVTIHNCFII